MLVDPGDVLGLLHQVCLTFIWGYGGGEEEEEGGFLMAIMSVHRQKLPT